jgi:hypothetical protein
MTTLSTWTHQGGPTMYGIFALVLPGTILVGFHAIWPRRWSWWAGLGVLSLVLLIGLGGTLKNRARVSEYADQAPELERDFILERGNMEADRPLELAGIVGGAFAVGLVVGQLRRRRRW